MQHSAKRDVVKPLLIAAVGRTFSSAPFGRREDDVELRRVPVLPNAASLDPSRATVIVLDRALLAGAGDTDRLRALASRAAIVGFGDAGEAEPPDDFSARSADELRRGRRAAGRDHDGAARRLSPRGGARRAAPRAVAAGTSATASSRS